MANPHIEALSRLAFVSCATIDFTTFTIKKGQSNNMATNHQIQIIGFLGADPVLRHTPSGTPVTTLRVAVNAYRGQGRPAEVFWYNVEVWSNTAVAAATHLAKGKQVMVTGEMRQPRIWTDRNGNPRCELEINADPGGVRFLDRPSQATQQAQPQVSAQEEAPIHIMEKELQGHTEAQELTSGEMSLEIDMDSPL